MKREKGVSLSQVVYDSLEKDILKGVYPSGENLTEMKLCEAFGVSRTPVREALRRLEENGLVQIEVNKGAVVRGITEQDLKEIYTIRMYIEGLAARWAAENVNDEVVERLRRSVNKLEHTSDQNADAEDNTFHSIIYDACNSRILKNILMEFHNYINSATRNPFSNPIRAKEVAKEHKAILEAIEKGDGELAEKLAKDHVYFAYHTQKESL